MYAVVTDRTIEPAVLQEIVVDPACGAIAQFIGVVRDHDGGRQVTGLEYQTHPDAQDAMQEIVTAVAAEFPSTRLAAAHRFGTLTIGDIAFAAVAASAHRDDAFSALRELVERVKAELPIWKRQQFSDGSHEWVNFA